MGSFLQFTVSYCIRNKEDVCTWALPPGGNKPVIPDVLTRKIEGTSWLVVDGQTRVIALGKPQVVAHFGDLAHTFFVECIVNSVLIGVTSHLI